MLSGRSGRIALLYDDPVSLTQGRLRMNRGYGLRVDALAEYFEQVVVCNPVARFELPSARYEPRAGNVSLEALPYFASVVGSLLVLPRCAGVIWRASRGWDLLHVTLPNALGFVGYLCARGRGIPVVLAIQGDLETQYERTRYCGLSGVAARVAVWLFEWATRWMADHALAITQGNALCRKYDRGRSRVVSIPWSPVTGDLIVQRPDTCGGPQIRLLFVGALLERKGIIILLDALRMVRERLDTVVLTYVGMGPAMDELARRVRESGLAEYVELKGGVFDEVQLWREFDAADVFVFPTYAEGFPRVIFEAMARGLPVVTSRVSGIPEIVRDGREALLVTPGSPAEVAIAIIRVVSDRELRRSLIRRGRERVGEYTLEATTRRRVEAMRGAYGTPR